MNSNDSLIDWSSEFVMNDGERATPYYLDHENFVKPYFSVTYKKDTLIATTLQEVNSCGKIVADIEIINDTIRLSTNQSSEIACTSVKFEKFTYIINNPSNKKFVVKSIK